MEKGSDENVERREGNEGTSLLVILIGAPGSGKSTFCEGVMKSVQNRRWVRVCQDSIANGKAGTKLQCVKNATDALKEGNSVFIDRCNLDREQRAEFMKLGIPCVDVHAVVLDLPARLCISRSVKRSGHEGNLQGGKAAAVVSRMLQKKELPKISEGFSRITFCQNEKDVQNAVDMYSSLGPFDSLPSGCFGQKSGDSKVQLGIMKFMKKVDPSKSISSDANCSSSVSSKEESMQKDNCDLELASTTDNMENKDDKDSLHGSSPDDASLNAVRTLAFPSISTSDFQFDHEKASDIIVETVGDFLNKAKNVRLVLVDLSDRSNILSLVRSKAAKENINPKKFMTVVGDITRLCTEGKIRANVIVNAANWRLKPGGGGVNAAIFKAAGEALETSMRKCAGTLNPGNSIVIPLPSTSPLYQREGVTHVIHVLGPNMNTQRPNCLKNDYVKGCKILRDAYSLLFENFRSIVEGSTHPLHESSDAPQKTPNQLSRMDLKMKRDTFREPERNKKSKGDDHGVWNPLLRNDGCGNNSIKSGSPADKNNLPMPDINAGNTSEKKTWSSWAQALHKIAMLPEQHKVNIVEQTDDYIVLNDLYPKAKQHILILCKLYGLDSLSDIRMEHLSLLKKMHLAGLKWAQKFLNDDAALMFRLGYHSVPSMRQLHLHVISQDFGSAYLKNKKHWNSFNTAFFRDSIDVLEEIEMSGVATINDENLLSVELRCHRCGSAHPNVPKLKSHISRCDASFPEHFLQNGRLVTAFTGATYPYND